MIKKLKASVHSLTTSIISDLSCPKGRTEAGVTQRLAGRRVCLSGTESGKDMSTGSEKTRELKTHCLSYQLIQNFDTWAQDEGLEMKNVKRWVM